MLFILFYFYFTCCLYFLTNCELSPALEHSSRTRDLANSYQTIQIRYGTCRLDPIHPAGSLCVLGLTSKQHAVRSSASEEREGAWHTAGGRGVGRAGAFPPVLSTEAKLQQQRLLPSAAHPAPATRAEFTRSSRVAAPAGKSRSRANQAARCQCCDTVKLRGKANHTNRVSH